MGIQAEAALKKASGLIEVCDFSGASSPLVEVLAGDLDNEALITAISWCKFWETSLRGAGSLSPFEQGELILEQWRRFLPFAGDSTAYAKMFYSFKKGVFSLALKDYSAADDAGDPHLKSELLRKRGICFKKLGSYEKALELLIKANLEQERRAGVVAEIADCYALCGETRRAKMLFREAFYIDAQGIDFLFLDSPLILALIERVENLGYTGAALKEWVAVYGVLLDVFTVKRPMRMQEIMRLRQDIFNKESEIRSPGANRDVLKPRLLYLYFMLIDYYNLTKDSSRSVSEVMLKMRVLDSAIYDLYR